MPLGFWYFDVTFAQLMWLSSNSLLHGVDVTSAQLMWLKPFARSALHRIGSLKKMSENRAPRGCIMIFLLNILYHHDFLIKYFPWPYFIDILNRFYLFFRGSHMVMFMLFCVGDTWRHYMGLSENSVPLHPLVLLIIIPTKWLFHWGYTPFSDIPICFPDVSL